MRAVYDSKDGILTVTLLSSEKAVEELVPAPEIPDYVNKPKYEVISPEDSLRKFAESIGGDVKVELEREAFFRGDEPIPIDTVWKIYPRRRRWS